MLERMRARHQARFARLPVNRRVEEFAGIPQCAFVTPQQRRQGVSSCGAKAIILSYPLARITQVLRLSVENRPRHVLGHLSPPSKPEVAGSSPAGSVATRAYGACRERFRVLPGAPIFAKRFVLGVAACQQ